jgi:hypothetical protein
MLVSLPREPTTKENFPVLFSHYLFDLDPAKDYIQFPMLFAARLTSNKGTCKWQHHLQDC